MLANEKLKEFQNSKLNMHSNIEASNKDCASNSSFVKGGITEQSVLLRDKQMAEELEKLIRTFDI